MTLGSGSQGVIVMSLEWATKAPQLPGFGVPEPLRSEPWALAVCFPRPGVRSATARAWGQCTQPTGRAVLILSWNWEVSTADRPQAQLSITPAFQSGPRRHHVESVTWSQKLGHYRPRKAALPVCWLHFRDSVSSPSFFTRAAQCIWLTLTPILADKLHH